MDDIVEFYSRHLETPGAVIVATTVDNLTGVFGSLESAHAWTAKQQESCVIAPYIIDHPDYGNIPENARN